jgi:HAD superfamily hydrolase (TIGR01490 family)
LRGARNSRDLGRTAIFRGGKKSSAGDGGRDDPVNSPDKIGAFFDLDGTLVAPPSLEWQFFGYLLGRDAIGDREIGRWLGQCAKDLVRDPHAATTGNKKHLAGLRESLVADWADSLAPDSPRLFTAGVERLAWHLAQGHRVFLISGTLKPLAEVLAPRLPGPVEICATDLEARGGYWTGRLAGERMSGEAKARDVRSLAARFGLALWDSYAYGNSIADLPMLDSVGHRVAVNPSGRLGGIARRERWQCCDWAEAVVANANAPARRLSPKAAR